MEAVRIERLRLVGREVTGLQRRVDFVTARQEEALELDPLFDDGVQEMKGPGNILLEQIPVGALTPQHDRGEMDDAGDPGDHLRDSRAIRQRSIDNFHILGFERLETGIVRQHERTNAVTLTASPALSNRLVNMFIGGVPTNYTTKAFAG